MSTDQDKLGIRAREGSSKLTQHAEQIDQGEPEISNAHAKAMAKREEEKQVAQYLEMNPEFFGNWENLLPKLKLPHKSGTAVSLVEKQVSVLRDRNIDLRNRLNKMLELAHENDELFYRTRELNLALMEAKGIHKVAKLLSDTLIAEFGVDAVTLFLYEPPAASLYNTGQVLRVVDLSELKSEHPGLVPNTETLCTPLRSTQAQFLFPSVHREQTAQTTESSSIGSAALVPIHHKGSIGLLAIGSFDSGHFKANMGTLFIDYIAQILARVLAGQLAA